LRDRLAIRLHGNRPPGNIVTRTENQTFRHRQSQVEFGRIAHEQPAGRNGLLVDIRDLDRQHALVGSIFHRGQLRLNGKPVRAGEYTLALQGEDLALGIVFLAEVPEFKAFRTERVAQIT
jgi:hypothetical protein